MNIQFLTDASNLTRPVRTVAPSPQKRRTQVAGNRRGGGGKIKLSFLFEFKLNYFL